MSIEDIKDLVRRERESELELLKAKEEAQSIIEKAKIEAKKIMDEAQNHTYYEKLAETEAERLAEKRKALEKECDDVLGKIQEEANKNMEKTVSFILNHVLTE